MGSNQQGEINTDPRFIYGDDANVIAYRLGIVETDVQAISVKLDRVINEYPTVTMLNLILDPIKSDLKDLQKEREKERTEQADNASRMKMLIYAAFIGPVGTFIVAMLTAGIIKR